jgi:hypothetical protein
MKTKPQKKKKAGQEEEVDEKVKLKGSEDIGITDYMSEIDTERKRKLISVDYQEDDVLYIVNHKRRWKKTLSKKAQRMLKVKHMDDKELRMN